MNRNDARPGGCEANSRSAIAMERAGRRPSSAPSLSMSSDPCSGNASANGTVRCPPAGMAKRASPGMPPVRAATSTSMLPMRTALGASAGGSQEAQTSGVQAGKLAREVSSNAASLIHRRPARRVRQESAIGRAPVGFGLDRGFDDVLAGLECAGPHGSFLAGAVDGQLVGGVEFGQLPAVEALQASGQAGELVVEFRWPAARLALLFIARSRGRCH